MALYCLRLGKQKKRCLVEVHDIADLAGRIGRGLMEQVFTTCRVAIAYDGDTFNSKNTGAQDWREDERAGW